MPVTSALTADGSELNIVLSGRFDFSAQLPFRQAYERTGAKPARFNIDMGEVSYLDQSALGMLLVLRDHAGGAAVQLANCSAEIRGALQRANFERLFKIS